MKVNEKGVLRDKYVRKEALKIFILGPLYAAVMVFLTYLSMSRWMVFFYATILFFILMMIFFIIVAPIIMLKRHNRTIKQISFDDGNIIIEVFSALWLRANEYRFPKNDIKVSNSRFRWYGKKGEEKEGYTIKAGDDRIFYLVKEFFSETDLYEIEKHIFN